jgi:rubrerythrin
MKEIERLADRMDEELEGLEEYVEEALEIKEKNPSLANTFFVIAGDEKKHYNMLHMEVQRMIAEHKEKHGDPPPAMAALYDFVHKKQIKRMAKIEAMMNMFAGK